MEAMLAFVLAGFALAGSPGPATLSLAAAGAAHGARRGLAYMTGIIIGMIAVMAIAATGTIGLVLALPGATLAVAVASAAYFVYLAIRIALAPPLAEDAPQRRPPSVAGGIFLSLVNPKGYAAMVALFSGFVLVPGHLALDAMAKAIVLLAIITAVNLAWLLAGSALTRVFRNPGTNRVINLVFAGLLLASVAYVLVL